MNFNPYTIDEQRRLALRSELKRGIAQEKLWRMRIEELTALAAARNADSDLAAEEHGALTSPLQAELEELDARQVDAFVVGAELPPECIERRQQILAEIQRANQAIEDRCEQNKKAVAALEQEIDALRWRCVREGGRATALADLCSPDTRRRQKLVEYELQFTKAAMKRLREELGGGEGADDVSRGILADHQFVVREFETKYATLQREQQRLRALALTE